jgi:hypothetical protein
MGYPQGAITLWQNAYRPITLRILLLVLMLSLCGGCIASKSRMPLTARSIPMNQVYRSQRLTDGQPQIQRGNPRPVIDGIGWVIGIPNKILLWDRRVDNHHIGVETEHMVSEYLSRNELTTVRVRLNQYHPLDDWRRLVRNDSVGAPWRLTFGTLSVLGETIFPGRIFGGDHYNPYTDTIHLYSDIPSIAIHEGGHAKDFARRKWKGTYAFAYTLPIVPLYHESLASGDAIAYLDAYGTPVQRAEAAKILYPAYGTYVGSSAGTLFPPLSMPLYYSSLLAGHAAGRYQARQIMSQPGPAVRYELTSGPVDYSRTITGSTTDPFQPPHPKLGLIY